MFIFFFIVLCQWLKELHKEGCVWHDASCWQVMGNSYACRDYKACGLDATLNIKR